MYRFFAKDQAVAVAAKHEKQNEKIFFVNYFGCKHTRLAFFQQKSIILPLATCLYDVQLLEKFSLDGTIRPIYYSWMEYLSIDFPSFKSKNSQDETNIFYNRAKFLPDFSISWIIESEVKEVHLTLGIALMWDVGQYNIEMAQPKQTKHQGF